MRTASDAVDGYIWYLLKIPLLHVRSAWRQTETGKFKGACREGHAV